MRYIIDCDNDHVANVVDLLVLHPARGPRRPRRAVDGARPRHDDGVAAVHDVLLLLPHKIVAIDVDVDVDEIYGQCQGE